MKVSYVHIKPVYHIISLFAVQAAQLKKDTKWPDGSFTP